MSNNRAVVDMALNNTGGIKIIDSRKTKIDYYGSEGKLQEKIVKIS